MHTVYIQDWNRKSFKYISQFISQFTNKVFFIIFMPEDLFRNSAHTFYKFLKEVMSQPMKLCKFP